MPKVVAVLWDLDDTLVNTTVTRLRAQRHMADAIMASFPFPSHLATDEIVEKAERLAQLFGSTYYVQHVSLLCRELVVESTARQRLIEIGCRAFREAFWQIEPVEGARETLIKLKERGHKLGIVSNGLYPFQMQKLAQTGLEEHFDKRMIFISSHFHRQFDLPLTSGYHSGENAVDPVELESAWLKDRVEKPWPWMFGPALKACNCPGSQAVYVGDRVTDFVSAKLAGVWSVQVNTNDTICPPALLSIEEPDFSVESLVDIFPVIDQIEEV